MMGIVGTQKCMNPLTKKKIKRENKYFFPDNAYTRYLAENI